MMRYLLTGIEFVYWPKSIDEHSLKRISHLMADAKSYARDREKCHVNRPVAEVNQLAHQNIG